VIRIPDHPVLLLMYVMKAKCVYCEVGTEVLNIRNTDMSSMLQRIDELNTSDLFNIVENRNALRMLQWYDNKFIKKSK
jgi:hypothetical protein